MRITYAHYVLGVLTRFGAILLFIVLVAASLLTLRFALKLATFPNPANALALLVCLIAGMIAVAPATSRGGFGLIQLMQAAFSVPPSVSGPLAVACINLEVAPLAHAARSGPGPINLKLWYPAETAAAQPAIGGRTITGEEFDDVVRLSKADTPYPVVLFAPGFGGRADEATFIPRNLASHGYVVAVIDDVALDSPRASASPADEDARLRLFDFSSAEAVAATMKRGRVRAEREASKALDALDRLEDCAQRSIHSRDRISFARVGFVGYSFGGAAAAESSFMDSRIAAVVNLDGSQFGRAAEGPVDVPYMMFFGDFSRQILFDPNSPRRYEYLLDQLALHLAAAQSVRPESHIFVLRGGFHETFADAFVRPSPRTALKWLFLDPYRAHTIIDAYLTGFLDTYLKGDRAGLIDAGDPHYPEVRSLNSQA